MKAVLVLNEMPKSCHACPLTYIDYGDDAYYGANTIRCVIDKDTIPHHGKWDECPLKNLPQKNKYDVEKYAMVDYENNITLGHYLNKGWNECLEEITK